VTTPALPPQPDPIRTGIVRELIGVLLALVGVVVVAVVLYRSSPMLLAFVTGVSLIAGGLLLTIRRP